MKKLIYIFSGLLIVGTSCKKEQLDLYPYNQIETGQAFNTEADVTLAVNGMYEGMRSSGSYYVGTWNIMGDVLADNLVLNTQGRLSLKDFYQWQYNGDNTLGLFSGGYTIVRRANAILENIDKFPAGSFRDNAKGEALAVARIAGIQAAKDTARLIPLCHPLPLSSVAVDFETVDDDALRITAEARTVAATGVEMEALTAAAVAALCLYDMTKALCRGAVVERVQLLHKSGGKSGSWDREPCA